MKKVCFILPEFNKSTASHYPYTLRLFSEYAKHNPSALFIEKAIDKPKNLKFKLIVSQKITLKPFNLFERLILLTNLRINGYKTFFIHYSYWSLFILKLISLILPTKIFYWHAEELKPKDLEEMKLVERALLTWAIKLSPKLVTAGPRLKQVYTNTFNLNRKKIAIIPNWIDRKTIESSKKKLREKLNLPKNKKIVLYVHRLSQRKGADLLPYILNKTQQVAKDTYFVIVGSGPLEKQLRSKISDKNVLFLGSVPQSKIQQYYQAADIFIMPSRREGFPRVILEAMAAGLPVVATDVGEVKNILPKKQHDFVASPEKLQQFVKALETAVRNTKLSQALAMENLRSIKKYSLEVSLRHLISLLAES